MKKIYYVLILMVTLMPLTAEAHDPNDVKMGPAEILRSTHRVSVGMTKGEVMRVLGSPEGIVRERRNAYGNSEKWYYGSNNPYSTQVVLLFQNGIYKGQTF